MYSFSSALPALFGGLFQWDAAVAAQFGYLLMAVPGVLLGALVGLLPGWLLGRVPARRPAVAAALALVPWRTLLIGWLVALPVFGLALLGIGEKATAWLMPQAGFTAGLWLTASGATRAGGPHSLPLSAVRAGRTALMVISGLIMANAVVGAGGLGRPWLEGMQTQEIEQTLRATGQHFSVLLVVDWVLAVPQALLVWFAARRNP